MGETSDGPTPDGKPKRILGALAMKYGPVPDPLDGWGPMTEEELDELEKDDDLLLPRPPSVSDREA